MSEFQDDGVLREKAKEFEVVEYPVHDGIIYEIYFLTEEQASQAVKDFWNARQTDESTIRGLQSGILNPTKHQITSGDRTHPMKLIGSDLKNHPGKLFKVQFNGNTDALSEKGVKALRKLGYI